jgi:hypothetical protein
MSSNPESSSTSASVPPQDDTCLDTIGNPKLEDVLTNVQRMEPTLTVSTVLVLYLSIAMVHLELVLATVSMDPQ